MVIEFTRLQGGVGTRDTQLRQNHGTLDYSCVIELHSSCSGAIWPSHLGSFIDRDGAPDICSQYRLKQLGHSS